MPVYNTRTGDNHLGLFRDAVDSDWYTQSSASDAQFYWMANLDGHLCASVDKFAHDDPCSYYKPMTCVTPAQGQVSESDTRLIN